VARVQRGVGLAASGAELFAGQGKKALVVCRQGLRCQRAEGVTQLLLGAVQDGLLFVQAAAQFSHLGFRDRPVLLCLGQLARQLALARLAAGQGRAQLVHGCLRGPRPALDLAQPRLGGAQSRFPARLLSRGRQQPTHQRAGRQRGHGHEDQGSRHGQETIRMFRWGASPDATVCAPPP
jgi:hypothetical protein